MYKSPSKLDRVIFRRWANGGRTQMRSDGLNRIGTRFYLFSTVRVFLVHRKPHWIFVVKPEFNRILTGFQQGRALYGPIPVKTESFRELRAPLVHTNFGGNSYGPIIDPYLFLAKFAWTNGPESSSKVSPYTGIGPWMAIPSFNWISSGF